MILKNKTTVSRIILVLTTLALFAFVFSTTTRIHWDILAILSVFSILLFLILKFRLCDRNFILFGRQWKSVVFVDLFLATAYSLFIFKILIHTFFDDAGFLLRYLDHFRNGYFFTFNLEEGPVMGISSFIYGLLCGLLAMTRIFDNNTLVLLLAFAGNITLAFVLLQIAGQLFSNKLWKYLFWASVLFGTKMYFNVAISGMETPVHLTIVFATILFFLKKNNRLFFFFAALSIISKLDAAPVIVVSGLVFLFNNRKNLVRINFKNPIYRGAFYYFFIPLLVYILFTFWVFGSPLPQSAYAKLYFHHDQSGVFFPYMKNFVHDKYLLPQLILLFLLFGIHVTESIKKGFSFFINNFGFGLMFFATLLFYYIYNPGENMLWYYAMPGLLMSAQIVFSIFYLLQKLPVRISNTSAIIFSVALLIFNLSDIKGSKRWMNRYLNVVENERVRIGKYLGDISTENETLMAGHGYTGRYFKGYVLDISGLNSRVSTDFRLNKDLMLLSFQPDFIIQQAWPYYLGIGQRGDYRLSHIFYDISIYSMPVWLLYEKNNDSLIKFISEPLEPDALSGYSKITRWQRGFKVRGDSLSIEIPAKAGYGSYKLITGVIRTASKFSIEITFYQNNNIVLKQKMDIEPTGFEMAVSHFVKEVQLVLPARCTSLKIGRKDMDKAVVIVDPFVVYKNDL